MANITFDTDDFYDDVTLKEMVEQETRWVICEHVKGMFGREKGIDNLVYNAAAQTVGDVLDEVVPDYKDKIVEQVQDVIENLGRFEVFHYSDKPAKIIEETVEEIRPMLQEKAKQVALEKVAEQVDAEQIVDYVCEEFYNIVSKQLSGDNE